MATECVVWVRNWIQFLSTYVIFLPFLSLGYNVVVKYILFIINQWNTQSFKTLRLINGILKASKLYLKSMEYSKLQNFTFNQWNTQSFKTLREINGILKASKLNVKSMEYSKLQNNI